MNNPISDEFVIWYFGLLVCTCESHTVPITCSTASSRGNEGRSTYFDNSPQFYLVSIFGHMMISRSYYRRFYTTDMEGKFSSEIRCNIRCTTCVLYHSIGNDTVKYDCITIHVLYLVDTSKFSVTGTQQTDIAVVRF